MLFLYFICLRYECMNISMMVANIAIFIKQRFQITIHLIQF